MKKLICGVLAVLMALSMLAVLPACNTDTNTGDELVCGVTIFEPMNYKENGVWTGFDTELALLVGEKLGMTVKFQEINWDNKYLELESGAISCIWNGFTANTTDADTGLPRSELVDFSYSYMLNQQCVVINAKNADQFQSIKDLEGKIAAAEKGSAGENAAVEAIGADGILIASASQIDTFIEVASGAVECAVVDILLAQKMVGTGNYDNLIIADIELESEVYAVGFKKGSDLTQKVNDALKALYDEGKMLDLATKYGIENTLLLDTSFTG